jgi:hypothetical protein
LKARVCFVEITFTGDAVESIFIRRVSAHQHPRGPLGLHTPPSQCPMQLFWHPHFGSLGFAMILIGAA